MSSRSFLDLTQLRSRVACVRGFSAIVEDQRLRQSSLGYLRAIERKPLADFVARASGAEEAFVQEEFFRYEPGEVRLMGYFGFEFTEALSFASRERDVGLEGTSLGNEAAKLGRCGDTFLKQKQFWLRPDTGKENPGAIEEAQPLKPNGNRRQTQPA